MYYLVQYRRNYSTYNIYCDKEHNTTGISSSIISCMEEIPKIDANGIYKSLAEFCEAHSAVVLAKFTSSKDFYNHYPELLI